MKNVRQQLNHQYRLHRYPNMNKNKIIRYQYRIPTNNLKSHSYSYVIRHRKRLLYLRKSSNLLIYLIYFRLHLYHHRIRQQISIKTKRVIQKICSMILYHQFHSKNRIHRNRKQVKSRHHLLF